MLDQYHTRRNRKKRIALLLDVTPQFYEAEPIKKKLSLWYLFHYVRLKKAMIQLIIGLLGLRSLLQLVFPFLTHKPL